MYTGIQWAAAGQSSTVKLVTKAWIECLTGTFPLALFLTESLTQTEKSLNIHTAVDGVVPEQLSFGKWLRFYFWNWIKMSLHAQMKFTTNLK